MKEKTALVAFWKNYDRKEVLKCAIEADELGYDSFWLAEAWGYEIFSLLTEIAIHTKNIKIGTGIVNVFSRSPGLLAMHAATPGRDFRGTLHPRAGDFGSQRHRGVSRRALQEAAHQDAPVHQSHPDPHRRGQAERRWRRPLGTAPLQARNDARSRPGADLLRVPQRGKRFAWSASWPTDGSRRSGRSTRWTRAFALLAEGAERTGRNVEDIEVTPFTMAIPLPDRELAKASARGVVSFYIGGMGVYYHAMLSRMGFAENADEVRDLYNNKQRKEGRRCGVRRDARRADGRRRARRVHSPTRRVARVRRRHADSQSAPGSRARAREDVHGNHGTQGYRVGRGFRGARRHARLKPVFIVFGAHEFRAQAGDGLPERPLCC